MKPHENADTARTESRRPAGRSRLGFRLIGAMKLAGGLLLAAAGFGIFRLIRGDVGTSLEHIVSRLHLDPDNRLVQETVARVAGMDHAKMKELGLGTFFYAVLETAEGVGLLMLKRWAEWLTVIATASLLPLELYEVARKVNAVRVGVLAVNIAVLIYLIVKMREPRPGLTD